MIGLLFVILLSQSSSGVWKDAPTVDQYTFDENENDFEKQWKSLPSSKATDFGGSGKLKSLRIRGAKANETGVFLEGIRLNSSQSGEFDLSTLHSFGLEDPIILRGAFAPTAESSSGQIHFRLPHDPKWISELSVGSFSYSRFAQQTPFGSISIEQSENDFKYENADETAVRSNNSSQVINARAFYRKKNYQIWAQTLFSDQVLPGALDFPSPRSDSTTYNQTLAYQGGYRGWQWSLWGQYQDIQYKNEDLFLRTQNRIWYSGLLVKKSTILHDEVSWENSASLTQDYLSSKTFDSPVRNTAALATALLWKNPLGLFHPRIRVKYVSDLKQAFHVQPGLGARHPLYDSSSYNSSLSLYSFWNISLSYRAPNFSELYFESPPSIANPDLDRQKTYQGDLGLEVKTTYLEAKQVFFTQRTEDLLETQLVSNNQYQVVNGGTLITFGTESRLNLHLRPWAEFVGSHTWTDAQVGGQQRSFQPKHTTQFEPRFLYKDLILLAFPLQTRSSMSTTTTPLNWQWEFGLRFQARYKKIIGSLHVYNLLAWNQIEVPGYPLPQETWVRSSLRYEW